MIRLGAGQYAFELIAAPATPSTVDGRNSRRYAWRLKCSTIQSLSLLRPFAHSLGKGEVESSILSRSTSETPCEYEKPGHRCADDVSNASLIGDEAGGFHHGAPQLQIGLLDSGQILGRGARRR
jgi:hypothetical protein